MIEAVPHGFDLVLTLTGGLSAALVCGYLTQRLGVSPIVGYLLAGILVGPFTPGFVADTGLAEQMAEIGVMLLMFGVGLQFHVEELLAVRRVAVPGALVQSAVATVLGAVVAPGPSAGTGPPALVFGVALSVASTVVLIRVLVRQSQPAHAGRTHRRRLAGRRGLFTVIRARRCCRRSSAATRGAGSAVGPGGCRRSRLAR